MMRSSCPTTSARGPPYSGAAWEAAEALRGAFRATMGTVGVSSLPHAVFSPACFSHCLTEGPAFRSVRVDGHSLADRLRAWMASPTGGHVWMDGCTSFNCSVGCPA